MRLEKNVPENQNKTNFSFFSHKYVVYKSCSSDHAKQTVYRQQWTDNWLTAAIGKDTQGVPKVNQSEARIHDHSHEAAG